MRKIALLTLMIISSSGAFSQSKDSNKDSLLLDISQRLDRIENRIKGNDRYKMYKTENLYTLLKLDTATGKIQQVQWALGDDMECTVNINSEPLSYISDCGTFELYPTQNMYQFILLNKENGQTWHVQWGMESKKRWIRRIY